MSAKRILIVIFLFMGITGNIHAEMDYFDSGIDYWNQNSEKKPKKEDAPVKADVPKTPDDKKEADKSFDWQKYLDPKNDEFFKEGDYQPPAPFMEIARNPTDRNIELWFAYIDKKNVLSKRLQERISEYLHKNTGTIAAEEISLIKNKLANMPTSDDDSKRFRFRMYFDSRCPHCKKMFSTLERLQDLGFYVEAKQINSAGEPIKSSVPVTMADKKEAEEQKIDSVPLLMIGDMREKKVYRLNGYHDADSILKTIKG